MLMVENPHPPSSLDWNKLTLRPLPSLHSRAYFLPTGHFFPYTDDINMPAAFVEHTHSALQSRLHGSLIRHLTFSSPDCMDSFTTPSLLQHILHGLLDPTLSYLQPILHGLLSPIYSTV